MFAPLNVDEPKDLHRELLPYDDVLSYLLQLERKGELESYVKGTNEGGRWFFQILNKEFVEDLTNSITMFLLDSQRQGPVLEVMSGDGKLTEFLSKFIQREIIATDSRSGNYDIVYPKWVVQLDALEAIQQYNPSVVILSWEPYWSSIGSEIVDMGVPTVWIGDPNNCAVHSGIFDREHSGLNSRYALGRYDRFCSREFNTDIFLFNIKMDRD